MLHSWEQADVRLAARTITLQRDAAGVIDATVAEARRLLDVDLVWAALPADGEFRMVCTGGARDPRFKDMRLRPGVGLGGRVLADAEIMLVSDYERDSGITSDFVDIVSRGEGLHSIVCVPVRDPTGTARSLLYSGRREVGAVGSGVVGVLSGLAGFAEIGIDVASTREQDVRASRMRDRQRLAKDLHDSVAQSLFGIAAIARNAMSSDARDDLLEPLGTIASTARQARSELAQTLERLGESDDQIAVEARLEGEVRLFELQSDCKVQIVRSGNVPTLGNAKEDLVVDVVLEGLRNAVRHGNCDFALVYLDGHPERLRVCVHGRPRQLETPPAVAEEPGVGLALLARRATQLRGRLELDREAHGGAALRLDLDCSRLAGPR